MSSYQIVTEADRAGVRHWRVWWRELVGVFDSPAEVDAAMAADRDRRAHLTGGDILMTDAELDVLARARELARRVPRDLPVIEVIGPGPDHEDYADIVIDLLHLLDPERTSS